MLYTCIPKGQCYSPCIILHVCIKSMFWQWLYWVWGMVGTMPTTVSILSKHGYDTQLPYIMKWNQCRDFTRPKENSYTTTTKVIVKISTTEMCPCCYAMIWAMDTKLVLMIYIVSIFPTHIFYILATIIAQTVMVRCQYMAIMYICCITFYTWD